MIQIFDIDQGTYEWYKLRDGLHTGSNAYKLLKTKDKSYSANTSDNSFKGNFSTDRGHILEDQAIQIYEMLRNVEVARVGFIKNTEYPTCGYSPDGLLNDRIIEVKAFNRERHLKNAEELEMEIQAQVQFGQLICEKKLTDVVLFNPQLDADKAFIIIQVKKNAKIHNNLKQRIKDVY